MNLFAEVLRPVAPAGTFPAGATDHVMVFYHFRELCAAY